jgi:hypothetical protein
MGTSPFEHFEGNNEVDDEGNGVHCNNDPDCLLAGDDDLYHYYRLGNETCDIDCQHTLQGLFVFGTMMDSIALGLNFAFALVADIVLFINPAIYAAMVIEYQGLSIIPNIIGSVGGLTWIVSGFVSGDNYLEVTNVNGVVNVSGSIAQDTIATILIDSAGWIAPWAREPNGATATGAVGVLYDILRNPFDPMLPTVLQPTFSFSIDTNSFFH